MAVKVRGDVGDFTARSDTTGEVNFEVDLIVRIDVEIFVVVVEIFSKVRLE